MKVDMNYVAELHLDGWTPQQIVNIINTNYKKSGSNLTISLTTIIRKLRKYEELNSVQIYKPGKRGRKRKHY